MKYTNHVGPRRRIHVVVASDSEPMSVTHDSDTTHLDVTYCLMNIREGCFTTIDIGEPGAHEKQKVCLRQTSHVSRWQ
jgi:hypothetical protein